MKQMSPKYNPGIFLGVKRLMTPLVSEEISEKQADLNLTFIFWQTFSYFFHLILLSENLIFYTYLTNEIPTSTF